MALFLTTFTNFKNHMLKMKKGRSYFENYSDNYNAWLLKRVQESLYRKNIYYTRRIWLFIIHLFDDNIKHIILMKKIYIYIYLQNRTRVEPRIEFS